ncbi:MAG TPA: ABC transporter permease [Cyclobacteriaceae bacterium]|nr:ABC transporter permease [Cyclobacteriaceae bacterium]
MLRNYFRIAVRNILRHRFFSVINIFGLAVSMSACLLIISMLADQKKYDRFHPGKDRIFRILSKRSSHSVWSATSPYLLHDELLDTYSGIEQVVSIRPFIGGDIKYNENIVTQAGLYADENFFRLFNFALKQGDPLTALKDPHSLVLTESMSGKLFGDENPLGKTVSFADRCLDPLGLGIESDEKMIGDFKITGVISEMGYKTHMRFDFIASMASLHSLVDAGIHKAAFDDWNNMWEFYNYVLLEPGKNEKELAGFLDEITVNKYNAEDKNEINFEAQPLTQITPGRFTNNPLSFSLPREGYYFLSALGLIVLFSACFNYTNLSLARGLSRAKEIGLRKINGARKGQIFFQFVSEAVVLSLVALVLAVIILQFLKRGFSGFWVSQYLPVGFDSGIAILLIFVLFSIVTGFLAGFLPAAYLSSFNPLRILTRNNADGNSRKGSFIFSRPVLGKSLVVAQFVFSMVLILSTLTLFAQLKHLMVAEYGFDRNNIINIRLHGNDYATMANELSGHPDVLKISASNLVPATGFSYGSKYRTYPDLEDSIEMPYFGIDQNFIGNFGLTLVAGRNFPENSSRSTEQYVIMNESAIRELGFSTTSEAIGRLVVEAESKQPVEIIGIVKDFNYELFMENIRPLTLRYNPDEFRYLNLKISGSDIPGTLKFLESKWKDADKVHPFNYKFFDEQLAKTHAIFGDILSMIGFVAFLAISISSLGLLGMATFAAETRRKEIGIRKVLGAEIRGLLVLLSGGFFILLIIAAVIAIPLSYLINNAWLQEFAYRISMGPAIFLGGMLIVFLIGLLTIGSQTLKAAMTNPAAVLRDE